MIMRKNYGRWKNYEEEYIRAAKDLTPLEACDEFIRAAREVLDKITYLTTLDRRRLDGGINCLEQGRDLRKNGSPEALKQAADLWLIGAFHLGAICVVSTTEAKYWEIKKRGGPKRPGKRSKETQAWKNYVRSNLPEAVQSNPDFNPKELAEEFILDKSAPKSLPKDAEYLARFIHNELKELVSAGKKEALRLVRGGRA
jgi:hypothetical protein